MQLVCLFFFLRTLLACFCICEFSHVLFERTDRAAILRLIFYNGYFLRVRNYSVFYLFTCSMTMAIPSTVKMHGTLSTKTHSLEQYRYMSFACLYQLLLTYPLDLGIDCARVAKMYARWIDPLLQNGSNDFA